MNLLATFSGEKHGPVLERPRPKGEWLGGRWEAPKACRVPPDALPMISGSPERKGLRGSPRGSPAARASAPLSVQRGDCTHSPQEQAAKEAQPPPWPWGLTKAELAQGSAHVPHLAHLEGLPRLACGPRLRPCPAPPSLGPFLKGQVVRSEGPSPWGPTCHPGAHSPRPAPSLQCRLGLREAIREDGRRGA